MKGIYGLMLDAHDEINVGRLGTFKVDGGYIYVGSAQGPGGLEKRIARHRAVAEGSSSTRHWHIDYLLGISQRLDVLVAVTSASEAECALAHELSCRTEGFIGGFGASDCRCPSHLFQIRSWDRALLVRAFEALNLQPVDHR